MQRLLIFCVGLSKIVTEEDSALPSERLLPFQGRRLEPRREKKKPAPGLTENRPTRKPCSSRSAFCWLASVLGLGACQPPVPPPSWLAIPVCPRHPDLSIIIYNLSLVYSSPSRLEQGLGAAQIHSDALPKIPDQSTSWSPQPPLKKK